MFKCFESTGEIFSTEKEKKSLFQTCFCYFSKLSVRNEGLKEKRRERKGGLQEREGNEENMKEKMGEN